MGPVGRWVVGKGFMSLGICPTGWLISFRRSSLAGPLRPSRPSSAPGGWKPLGLLSRLGGPFSPSWPSGSPGPLTPLGLFSPLEPLCPSGPQCPTGRFDRLVRLSPLEQLSPRGSRNSPERCIPAGRARSRGRSSALSLSGLVGLSGWMGLAVGLGTGAVGERARAMEPPLPQAPSRQPGFQTAEPRTSPFREVEVSDLGSNTALPEALRAVFFPLPPEFAERAPAGERQTTRLAAGDGGGAGRAGEGMPSLGYPINQAPIEISAFGMRWSDARAAWKMHTGIDLIVTEGTPVLAAAAGRVLLVDEVSGYGLTVLVDHGQGWQTLYAHLFEIAVQPGDQVQRGQPLGRVGDSGRASTPHLHFEIRQRRGDRLVALDPAPLLRPREPGAIVQRP